jgi:TolA-binding protein
MASTQFLEVQDTPSREVQALREVIKSTSRTLDEMQKMFPTCDQRTSLVVEEESELRKRLEDLIKREKNLSGQSWDSDSTEQDMFTNSSPDDLNQSPLSPKYYLINDVI